MTKNKVLKDQAVDLLNQLAILLKDVQEINEDYYDPTSRTWLSNLEYTDENCKEAKFLVTVSNVSHELINSSEFNDVPDGLDYYSSN